MMRLMRRRDSGTDSTAMRREVSRLLIFLLVVGLIASLAWAALIVWGTGFDAPARLREGLLSMTGFGSVILAGWALVVIFALAFKRNWFRRYDLWLASAALTVAAIGALSFRSPSEGFLGWFALGGEVSLGGQLGDAIIGSQSLFGWLRVSAAAAVAAVLFALPALRAGASGAMALFNRRKENSGMESFSAAMDDPNDQEDDALAAPVPTWGAANGAAAFSNGAATSYAAAPSNSGQTLDSPPSNGDAVEPSPAPGYASQGRQPFDFGSASRLSAPVPSLSDYLEGTVGSDSLESGVRRALLEPTVSEPEPDDDADPFKPLNLSKLPEPVFAFRQEPAPTPEPEDEFDMMEDILVSGEVMGVEEADMPEPELSAPEALEEDVDEPYDEPARDAIEDENLDYQDTADPWQSASIVVVGDDGSSSVVMSDSDQNGFFTSPSDSASVVVIDDDSPLLPVNDARTEPSYSSRDENGRFFSALDSELDSGDDDDSDQSAVNGLAVEAASDTNTDIDDESETVLIEDFAPPFLEEAGPPPSSPMAAQPGSPFKANKYWAMDRDDDSPDPAPYSTGFGGSAGQSTQVTVPVIPAWRKPSARMLDSAPSNSISEEEQQTTASVITKTLADYGIEVGVRDIRPGPTVTMYGLTPGWIRRNKTVKQVDDDGVSLKDERGRLITKQVEEKTRVKVDSILAREKDLSLALKTPSIRLETPAMGQSLIGIEVPNPNPSLVTLRNIMESPEFQELRNKGAQMPVALGQGSGGESVVFDLAKMPHLLVAGATGSGKSVCLNAIVSCLITERTPAEMRMLLVDPKRVELTPYNGIPHLLAPVIVETDTVVGYLKGLIREMFDRYRRMEEVGVRNIEAYNEQMPDKMPFLCVVIDELADLMMTAAVDVEQSICRLAQLGRATGIHMIIATQRPSVDVLTGLIKANFPSRISFGVTSQVDSRTILDTGGADKLLGRGDMLYLPVDASKPSRVQSVFIGDSEIQRIVDFWKSAPRQPMVEIDLLGGAELEEEEAVESNPDRDEMIDKAIEIAITHRKLSTSLLQRRLRIGYPRAARLMDQLEEEGIVGPSDGSRSRDVIMNQN